MSELDVFEDLDHESSGVQGIDVWGILLRRKWIISAVALVAIALGVLYYLQADPVYESQAQVLIERKHPPAVAFTGIQSVLSNFDSETEKHPVVMASPQNVGAAADEWELTKLPMFATSKHPLSYIIDHLVVTPVTEKVGIYTVSFRGGKPDDVRAVVEAVVDNYGEMLDQTHKDTGDENAKQLLAAQDEAEKKLKRAREGYAEFRANAPLMWLGESALNLHQERLASIEKDRAALLIEAEKLDALLLAVEDSLDNRRHIEALYYTAEKLSRDEQPSRYETVSFGQTLLPLLLEQQSLQMRYGEDHPKIKASRRRIEFAQKFYQEQIGLNLKKEVGDGDLPPHVESTIRTYVASLEQQRAEIRSSIARLDELFDEEERESKTLAADQAKDEQWRREIDNSQTLYDSLVKSLEGVEITGGTAGYNYQVIAAPSLGEKVAPSLAKTMALALVLGSLAGFGLGYIVDIADKSFHNPLEVSKYLRLPVVGHIPMMQEPILSGSFEGVREVVCTLHDPRGTSAEAYRTVRTAMFFNARGKDHQLIQVTSPRPGDGKSTLSANLAVTIAKSGKSVLLIDADFRKPTQHKVFGLASDIGFSSVVQGKVDPQQAYQTIDGVDHLTVMVCGPRPENPSELLSSRNFKTTLEYLREQFDFVIVDTPPMLAVSDPAAVSAQVDGVLMTFRIDRDARPAATRARDMLIEVGADIVGVVVNGIGSIDSDSYYSYGSAGYAYEAARYGYAYQYKYGEDASVSSANGASRRETVKS
ncbi:MAG: polysaccharide biosynthesis tyrosine autokinase [Pirellulaceae bacterium]|nr:polysaccharide biosynthesis tyrosine autokinase [Planctomycetales bacterium]